MSDAAPNCESKGCGMLREGDCLCPRLGPEHVTYLGRRYVYSHLSFDRCPKHETRNYVRCVYRLDEGPIAPPWIHLMPAQAASLGALDEKEPGEE